MALLKYYYTCTFLLVQVMKTYEYVTWEFEPDIIRLGGRMTLICTINNLVTLNKGLIRQWSKGSELICFNGHPIDSQKYKEIVTEGNQFKLQINNLTELDLNCKYKCRYSFETQTQDIDISKISFEHPPTNETKAIVHTNPLNGTLAIHLHLEKVFPQPKCTAFIEDKLLSFEVLESTRKDLFYDLKLEHRSIYDMKCSQNVEVSCKLLIPYSILSQRAEECRITDDSISNTTIILISSIVTGIFVIMIIIFTIAFILKKSQTRTTRKKGACQEKREISDSSNSSSGTTKTTSTTDEDLEQSETLVTYWKEKGACQVKREISDSSNNSSGTTKTTSTTDEDLEQSETLVTYWKGDVDIYTHNMVKSA